MSLKYVGYFASMYRFYVYLDALVIKMVLQFENMQLFYTTKQPYRYIISKGTDFVLTPTTILKKSRENPMKSAQ